MTTLAGCDQQPNASSFTEADSAGIKVVTTNSGYAEWSIARAPEVSIGLVDGPEPYAFHDIAFAAKLSDGRLVAVDGRSREIRWFSTSGVHEQTVGGRGGGPGEFEMIGEVVLLPGDTIAIHDPRQQRVTWISPRGAWVRERRLDGGRSVQLLAAAGDLFVARREPQPGDHGREYSLSSSIVRLFRIGNDRVDTLSTFAGPLTALWVRHVNGQPVMTVSGGLPFEAVQLIGVTGDRIVSGAGNSPTMNVLRLDGSIERVVRFAPAWYEAVGEADRQQYVAHKTALAAARGGVVAEAANTAGKYLELLPQNHVIPAFDRALPGRNGSMWIRRYRPDWVEGDQEWLVLGRDGRIEGGVRVDGRFRPTHAEGGYVTGVQKDELDVEYVVTFRVIEKAQSEQR